MSYIEQIAQGLNDVVYCGPNNGTEVYLPGGLAVRLNTGAPNVLQFANRSGVTESFEAYNSIFFGNGGQQNLNIDANSISNGSTWINLDPDTMLTDGSDVQHVIICTTGVGDSKLWQVTAWRPTPTKVVIIGRLNNPATALAPLIEGVITEMHRITVSDSTTAVETFNGRTYRADEGWIPDVAGHFLNGSLYQSHGNSWVINPQNSRWGLVSDASGLSIVQHTVDVVFRRYPVGCIRRFGIFN